MVVGSFWTDFDVKLRIKQVLDTFESHNSRKNGLKVAFQRFILGHISSISKPHITYSNVRNQCQVYRNDAFSTHNNFDNIFEVVQYKKVEKTYIEIEKHEQNESNTILLLIELKLLNIENQQY